MTAGTIFQDTRLPLRPGIPAVRKKCSGTAKHFGLSEKLVHIPPTLSCKRRSKVPSKHQLTEPDSTIHTDGWEGYVGLEALGYRTNTTFWQLPANAGL